MQAGARAEHRQQHRLGLGFLVWRCGGVEVGVRGLRVDVAEEQHVQAGAWAEHRQQHRLSTVVLL